MYFIYYSIYALYNLINTPSPFITKMLYSPGIPSFLFLISRKVLDLTSSQLENKADRLVRLTLHTADFLLTYYITIYRLNNVPILRAQNIKLWFHKHTLSYERMFINVSTEFWLHSHVFNMWLSYSWKPRHAKAHKKTYGRETV